MKKTRSKLVTKVIELKKYFYISDEQIIKKKLGYSSSSIYESVLKYRHQNYVNRKPKQS
jgi:biotin operon repressor